MKKDLRKLLTAAKVQCPRSLPDEGRLLLRAYDNTSLRYVLLIWELLLYRMTEHLFVTLLNCLCHRRQKYNSRFFMDVQLEHGTKCSEGKKKKLRDQAYQRKRKAVSLPVMIFLRNAANLLTGWTAEQQNITCLSVYHCSWLHYIKVTLCVSELFPNWHSSR